MSSTLTVTGAPRPIIVDDRLLGHLSKFRWYYHRGYVATTLHKNILKRPINIRLENFILDISPARRAKIYHRLKDFFDFRTTSLRVTRDQYLGIYQDSNEHWHARYLYNFDGPFGTAFTAAEAYDNLIISLPILPINPKLNFLHNLIQGQNICKT
jgi:hypothetical protein